MYYNGLPPDMALDEMKSDQEVQIKLLQGNLDKAEQLCRTLVSRRGASAALQGQPLANARCMLGEVMFKQQKYSEAQNEFGLAYGYYKRSSRVESEDAVKARNHMALISFQQSYFSRAREIFKEVAQQQKEGTKKLTARYMIGRTFLEEKRFFEAEIAFRESIHALESTSGTNLGLYSDMLTSLGHSLNGQSKWEDAVSIYHKHIDILKEQDGENHPNIWKVLCSWGVALAHQGLHREAQLLFRDATVAFENQGGCDPFDLLQCKSRSGRTLSKLGQHDVAEQMIRQAIAGFETLGERGKTEMLINKSWLAYIWLCQNRRRESEELLQETLPEMIKTLGEWHADTQMARRYLEAIRGHAKQTVVTVTGNQNGTQESLSEWHPQVQRTKPYLEGVPAQVSQLPFIPGDAQHAVEKDLNQLYSANHEISLPYTDAQIDIISRVLKYSNNLSWAHVPRTYIILRRIGQLEKLDDLIKEGFSDYHFPVDELKLPNVLSPSMKRSFVEHQHLVLTASIGVEHGQHRQYQQENDAPFERICIMGKGGYGQVDKVQSKVSYREYARKQVYRGKAFRGASKEVVQMFISEIKILQRLRHRHIVELIGSFTDDKYMNLLMLPVATMDLARYLRQPDINKPELRTFYGCLAIALEYLHTQKIRHKDLKPQNILIDNGTVLLTDFGLSLDFTDSSGSTTVGMVGPCTRRYAAPEVLSGDLRNRSSDIWSLGAVYMEMSVVLKGITIQRLKDLYDAHDSWQYLTQHQPDEFKRFFAEVDGTGDSRDNVPLNWCREMLSVEQDNRPSASALVEKIMKVSLEGEMGFCGICCEAEEHEP